MNNFWFDLIKMENAINYRKGFVDFNDESSKLEIKSLYRKNFNKLLNKHKLNKNKELQSIWK